MFSSPYQYETTGNIKYVGPCFECGWNIYEGLVHHCPTGLRHSPTAVQVIAPVTTIINGKLVNGF